MLYLLSSHLDTVKRLVISAFPITRRSIHLSLRLKYLTIIFVSSADYSNNYNRYKWST